MKRLNFIFLIIGLALFAGCEELVVPELSSDNTMTSVKCIVVTGKKLNSSGSKPEDTKLEVQGSIAENGFITFSGISSLTDEQKKQAKFEAIVPLTATIVEKDGAGNIIGNGIGGLRTVSKTTYYFYVVAANGAERKYVIVFN